MKAIRDILFRQSFERGRINVIKINFLIKVVDFNL